MKKSTAPRILSIVALSNVAIYSAGETTFDDVYAVTNIRSENLLNLRHASATSTAYNTITQEESAQEYEIDTLVLRRSSSMDDFPSAAPSAAPTFLGNCCVCEGKKSYVPVTDMLTYDEHLIAARSRGCDLASIEDIDEQAAITLATIALGNMAGDDLCAFIGLYRPPSLTVPPLPAFHFNDVGWDWTDKCSFYDFGTFQYWGTNPGSSPPQVVPENNVACIATITQFFQGSTPGRWTPTSPYEVGPAVYECCIPNRTEDQCYVNSVATS